MFGKWRARQAGQGKKLPQPRPWPAAARGFTLTELLVVIAILGILTAVVLPGFVAMLPGIYLKGAVQQLYSDLQRAKIEAIKRNVYTVVQFDGVDCSGIALGTPVPGGSYTVFVDDGGGEPDKAKNNQHDEGELTLARSAMPRQVALCSDKASITFSNARAGFTPRGLPVGSKIGKVTLHNTRGNKYEITLSIAGAIRVKKL